MTPEPQTGAPVFRVIDAMDAPYSGQILRLRLLSGRTPTLKEMKGGRFKARSPKGDEASIKVTGFSLAYGKPNQARFARTGRVDVLSEMDEGEEKVSLQWTLSGPN